MSTLRTTSIIHGSSAVDNIVLDNQGRAIFGPNSPAGRAALYVNAQLNRVGVNTESPSVELDVDGQISATGNATIGGTLNVTGGVTLGGALTVNDVITSNRVNSSDSCFIAQRNGATVASINGIGQASFCEGDIVLRDEGGGNGALIDIITAGNGLRLYNVSDTVNPLIQLSTANGGLIQLGNPITSSQWGSQTIFNGTDFRTDSQPGTANHNLYLTSNTTSANGGYGASLAFSRIEYQDRVAAAITAVQTTADADQVGLAFFTHPSATPTNTIVEAMRIDNEGNLLLGIDTANGFGSPNAFVQRGTGTSLPATNALRGGGWSMCSVSAEPALYLSANITSGGTAGTTEVARGGIGFEYVNSTNPTNCVLGIFDADNTNSQVQLYCNSNSPGITLRDGGTAIVRDRLRVSFIQMQSDFSSGAVVWDTGLSINQSNGGGTSILIASRNTSNATSTNSAIYMLQWYYDGNNPPTATLISGQNFATFSVTGANTLGISLNVANWVASIIHSSNANF